MATQTQYYNLDKPSYDEVADIEVINANMDKIDMQMRNNADGVNFAKCISSDAYDNSKSYAVGDYCIYDNKLYRCITAIESAEEFNIAKWEQTTVGREVKQLNSNLDGLSYDENAGGKNLFDENEIFSSIGTKEDGYWCVNSVSLHNMYSDGFPISIDVNSQYTISFDAIGSDKATTIFYVKYTDGTKDSVIVYGNSESHYKLTTKAGKIISFIGATYSYGGIDKFKNFQIEKGSQETDYEPYIPSVKMLADEVSAQNESLDDYGLVNKATVLLQGGWNKNSSNKIEKDTAINKVSTEILQCIGGKTVSYKSSNAYDTYILFLDGSQTFINYVNSNSAEFSTVSPSNAKYVAFSFVSNSEITPQTIGHVGVYVDNAIDEIKNDLIVLEATSTIDMTASRELDDITSSPLTIPSGYKPIAMYGYNEENNDNISAIPLLVRSDGKVLFHAKNHSTSDQGIIHFRIRVTFKKVS